MQELMRAAPNPLEPYPTVADLPELLDPAASAAPEHTLLWELPGGGLAGFGLVSEYRNLYYRFRSGALTDAVERELMGWAVARARLIPGGDEPLTLDAAARDDDTEKVGLLLRNGFAPTGDVTLRMERSLREPFPEPEPPPGFALRPLAGEREVPAYVAAHRAAYGTERMTEAGRLAIMRQPHYRPDLDLVAVGPDGALAAFCVCAIDAEENARTGREEGEVAIVGTRPEFRGRGIARNMVLAGMRALRGHGMETAYLTVAGDNAAALRAYEAVGFRPGWRLRLYARPAC
jgi:ribosomal protein S18 acetylase RimI-like enzyme